MTRRKQLRIIVLGGAGLFVCIYALVALSPRWTSGDDKPTASVTEAVPSVTLVLTYRGTDAYEGIRIDADNNGSVCGSPTQERLGRPEPQNFTYRGFGPSDQIVLAGSGGGPLAFAPLGHGVPTRGDDSRWTCTWRVGVKPVRTLDPVVRIRINNLSLPTERHNNEIHASFGPG